MDSDESEEEVLALERIAYPDSFEMTSNGKQLTLEEIGTNRIIAAIDASSSESVATIKELSTSYNELHGVSLEVDLEKYFGLGSVEEFLDSDVGNDLLQVIIVSRKKRKRRINVLAEPIVTISLPVEGGLQQLLDTLSFCGGFAFQTRIEKLFVKRYRVAFDTEWLQKHFNVDDMLSLAIVPCILSKIRIYYICGKGWVFRLNNANFEDGGVSQFKYVLEACGGFANESQIKEQFLEVLCIKFDEEWRCMFFETPSRIEMTNTDSFKSLMWGNDVHDQWAWWLLDNPKQKEKQLLDNDSPEEIQRLGMAQITEALRLCGGMATELELERHFHNLFSISLDSAWLMQHFNRPTLPAIANLPSFNKEIVVVLIMFENIYAWRCLLRENLTDTKSETSHPNMKLFKVYTGVAEISSVLNRCGKSTSLDRFSKRFKWYYDKELDSGWLLDQFGTNEIMDLANIKEVRERIAISQKDNDGVHLELISEKTTFEGQAVDQLVDVLKSFGGSANHMMFEKEFAVKHSIDFERQWIHQHFNKNSIAQLKDVPSFDESIELVSGNEGWFYFTLRNRDNLTDMSDLQLNNEMTQQGNPLGTGVLLLTDSGSVWISNETQTNNDDLDNCNDDDDTKSESSTESDDSIKPIEQNAEFKPRKGLPQLLYALHYFKGIANFDQLRNSFKANGDVFETWTKEHFGIESPDLLTEHPDVASKMTVVEKCGQTFLKVNVTTFEKTGIAQLKWCLNQGNTLSMLFHQVQALFNGKLFTEFDDHWAETFFDKKLSFLDTIPELTKIIEIKRKTKLYRLLLSENHVKLMDRAEMDENLNRVCAFNLNQEELASIKKTDCDEDDGCLPPYYDTAYLLKTLTEEQIKEGISQIVDTLVDGGGIISIRVFCQRLRIKFGRVSVFHRLFYYEYVDYMIKFGDFDEQVEVVYTDDDCYLLVKTSGDWKKIEARFLTVLDYYNGQCSEGQFAVMYFQLHDDTTIFHKHLDKTSSRLTPGLISITHSNTERGGNVFTGPQCEKYIGRQRITDVLLKKCGGIAGIRKLRQFYFQTYNVSMLDDFVKYFGTNQIDKVAPLIRCNKLFIREGQNEKEFVFRPQCNGFYEDVTWKTIKDDQFPPGMPDQAQFHHTCTYVAERIQAVLREVGGKSTRSLCIAYLEDGLSQFDRNFAQFLKHTPWQLLKELATYRDGCFILTPKFEDKLEEVILECGGHPTLEQVQSTYNYIYKADFNDAWQERYPGVMSIAQLAEKVPKKVRITKHNSTWIFEVLQSLVKPKVNKPEIGRHNRSEFINHLEAVVDACGGDALVDQVASTYKSIYHSDFEKTWRSAFPACSSLADLGKRVDRKVRITQYRSTWRFRLCEMKSDQTTDSKKKKGDARLGHLEGGRSHRSNYSNLMKNFK